MLELNRLTISVAEMAEALAGRSGQLIDQLANARQALQDYARVTDELKEKLGRASDADPSWRGALPQGDRLDARRQLPWPAPQATLLASDGSQIYPDTHDIATYYLLNVGTIVLRQGSGQAPDIRIQPRLHYEERDLYGPDGESLIDIDQVNLQRDLWEMRALADLTEAERAALGGDMGPSLIALADGPLLPWVPQRLSDEEQIERVREFAGELARLRRVAAIPVGYVDRPRSANVLRLLHLASLRVDEITKERLRRDNPYRGLCDRDLFADLAPGQRTALFSATSEINETYASQGQRIYFCYLNVAANGDERGTVVVRVEVPEWIVNDEDRLDAALAAVWADCQLTAYPYVLTRAHELALVSRHERDALRQMLHVEMVRRGLQPRESPKANTKRFVGGR